MVRIGTPAAAQVLMEKLLESDTTLRFRTMSALNKLQRLHPEIETDAQDVGDGVGRGNSRALPLVPDSRQTRNR